MEIRQSHVLVTGSNRGIGLALAKELSKRGAHVHAHMRTLDSEIEKVLKSAGASSIKIWTADLSQRAGVESLLTQIKNEKIDILVNNAGLLTGGLIEEQPLDDIYSMFQVNVTALVHLTRGLLPSMIKRKRGKIVNNSSVSAIMRFPCASTYAASKAAVLAFSDCLDVELKDTGVTMLSLITPGIETRMFKDIEVKYGKNLEVPKDSISPESYAVMICDAIEKDEKRLEPTGPTKIGLKIAQHLPGLFRRGAERKFHR